MNNEVNYVSPFKKFVITIGNLPTAYMESMSYYEAITFLVNYLSNNVIPALNNNAKVVEELQIKFNELKNYVDNYFDNLNVQDEINNKLDDMAAQGQLAEIISLYLQAAGVLGYNTKADMKLAENLVDGSICRTLGENSYADGMGSLYKVRELDVSDVIDDDELVALYDVTLVAEKIPYSTNYKVANEATKRNFVLIGDSFAVGIDGDDNSNTVSDGGWADRFKAMYESKYPNSHVYFSQQALGGVYGFASSRPFLQVLQADEVEFDYDKNTITDIIVLGGTNDISLTAQVENAIQSFSNYCHTNYPNARISIGCIGTDISDLVSLANNYYRTCEKYGCQFINDTKALLCLKEYIGLDNTHLTASGYAFYQEYINQAILTGNCQFKFTRSTACTTEADFTSDITPSLYEEITQNTYTRYLQGGSRYQAPVISYYDASVPNDMVPYTVQTKIKLPDETCNIGYGLRSRIDDNYKLTIVSTFKSYVLNNNIHYLNGVGITIDGGTAELPNRWLFTQQRVMNNY